ncbi:MAG: 16S rRNA (uracil(1498)-N(3))-methyltransferase [Candidatus Eremiobacteraeota bacterium]|nr:16S rRNA (uracil(1498)-N(3))-methyltransferase [Candidatus Eremiobacteraeota bacterium]MBC5803292.1 16S rRNA (uracil(1498)-N(3))-methyltransferase [Candidatus Eremiobacteraeota bacterium]MBC5822180.1 16S rRNA (uracil(1498)-N(3))-methyltransferase [Candidatus Eremiobacteraeota bacterium]
MPRRPPRIFVAGIFGVGDVVEPAPDDARKLRIVLRARPGDAVEILDSSGRAYAAELIVERETVRAHLRAEKTPQAHPTLRLSLAQGMPTGAKMDFVVEKATELGVAQLVPFTSERTQAGDARAGKIERWRRLAKGAAQQCGRPDVPVLDEPTPFSQVCAGFGMFDVALVAWELADGVPLRERLPTLLAGARSALIVIGPEGGLSHDEAQLAERSGGRPLSLGARILRTETAGLVACSAVLYASGNL